MATPGTNQRTGLGAGLGGAAMLDFIAARRAILAPIVFVSLLFVIIAPLPPFLMDALIAANICLAVIMLMTTMYIKEPLDFSVFPSLLLGTTLFRLVLNIATTRLILTADASTPQAAEGVAGKVIGAFGTFVAGDSLIVGVIIFAILVIVQFVVITKGATRISEVAARFTLDAMPGKQMAIDADLNAGAIDEAEARQRRDKVANEADFFGAMDGASKFVRGDAVAGIIITIVNILGGFAVGAFEKGWDIGASAELFMRLTIGDGLQSQVPSFVIAIAAALVVTRAGSRESLGEEVAGQVTSQPVAMGIGAGFMLLLAVTPLPTTPMLAAAALLGLGAFVTGRGTGSAAAEDAQREAEAEAQAQEEAKAPPVETLLAVDAMELEVGYGLVGMVDAGQGGDLLDRVAATRRQLAVELGLVMPPLRIRDNMTIQPTTYRVKIRGAVVAEAAARPAKLLAMDAGIASGQIEGEKTREPAFGLDAWWIEPPQRERAEALNYTVVDPTSVLATHIAEIVKRHADELLSREEVNNLLEELKKKAPRLVEEVVPGVVKASGLQKVLQGLLREQVPIRDMETILETLSEWAPKAQDPDVLVEYVRNALRRTICQQYAVPLEDADGGAPASGQGSVGRIVCVTLDPVFEDRIAAHVDRSGAGTVLTMPAALANATARRIIEALDPVVASGHQPLVLASPQVRAAVRQILQPHMPAAVALGYNEIVPEAQVESMGLVGPPEEAMQGTGAAAM